MDNIEREPRGAWTVYSVSAYPGLSSSAGIFNAEFHRMKPPVQRGHKAFHNITLEFQKLREAQKVVRGGSWFTENPQSLRTATRFWKRPELGDDTVGFRVRMEREEQ